MLTRYGGQFFPFCGPRYFAEYNDELVPMYFDLDQPPARVVTRLPLVKQLLKLGEYQAKKAEGRRDPSWDHHRNAEIF